MPSASISIHPVRTERDLAATTRLFRTYAASLDVDLAYQDFEADGIMRYRIAVPPGLTGAFHYNVRLVSENFQVTSFAQSNPFLLV